MYRCSWFSALSIAALLFACRPSDSLAQAPGERAISGFDSSSEVAVYTGRQFPPGALRGSLRIQAAPDILLNGKPERLSAGSRVRNLSNAIVPPSTLGDVAYVVNYTRNGMGEVQDVWLLTAEEVKAKLPSMTASKPQRGQVVDDGKTPYHELPTFHSPAPQR